jgi:hypothetical protein
MFRIAKNAMAAFALTGLVLSQPALAASANRSGSPVDRADGIAGASTISILLAALVVGAVVAIIADDDGSADRPASP